MSKNLKPYTRQCIRALKNGAGKTLTFGCLDGTDKGYQIDDGGVVTNYNLVDNTPNTTGTYVEGDCP